MFFDWHDLLFKIKTKNFISHLAQMLFNLNFCALLLDIVKHTAWLNNFEGTLIIRTLGPDKLNWKPIIAELAATDSRNFLLDIPYWYAKDFLVLVRLYLLFIIDLL